MSEEGKLLAGKLFSILSTESVARGAARRPWTTIGVWVLVVVIALFLISSLLSDGITAEFDFNHPESKRANNLLEERLRGPKGTHEVVIVQSDTLTVDNPVYRQFVLGIFEELQALGPEIIRQKSFTNYYQTDAAFLVSRDLHTTIMPFTMAGDFDEGSDNIDRVIEVVDAAKGRSEFKVLMTGQASVGKDFEEAAQEGLEKGEVFGVPIALVILVLVFGALVAALIPVVLAAVSIVVALGAASLLGLVFGLSFFVTNLITMIGLAVGIDYSLFFVARYREERAHGLEKHDAIGRAGATASRTVLFSGMAVVLGLIGMLLVPSNVFISIGAGAIFVVIAAVCASMTLLPALLSLMGDGINRLSIPGFGRAQASYDASGSGGFWDWISRGVMRQPAISLLVAGGILIAGLIPFFDITTGTSGVSSFPDGFESKEGFLILDAEFSAGEVTPVEIVVDGDIDSQPVQARIERLKAALATDNAFTAPRPLEVSGARDLALLTVPVAGDAVSGETQDAVKRLRSQYVPAAFEGVPAKVHVTGETAFNIDFFSMAKNAAYVVFPFVLGISFILLMVVFRSIIVPIKAVLLNLLAVGATYGLLVLIFQKGVWNEAFGFQQADTIEAWIPIFLFAILFGLSMDYHVFLLSRIRERFDQTQDNTESVAFGIRSTGRLITGAALIMVAVFWGFAAGDLVGLQQMGFGLGTAILLDATIIRMVLVPASMKILGKWNWYLPSWLDWLPDFRVGPEMPVPAFDADSEVAQPGS